MTSESLKDGKVSEKSIKEALTKSKGDLFIASSYLHVATRELDRYISSSTELQLFICTIERVKQDSNYEKISSEQFKRELENKTRAYRNDALDEIYKIATLSSDDTADGMPPSAALYEVKLKAAIKLLGDKNEAPVNMDHQNILVELNNQYIQSAPRIKSVRAIQIEYEIDK